MKLTISYFWKVTFEYYKKKEIPLSYIPMFLVCVVIYLISLKHTACKQGGKKFKGSKKGFDLF